MDDIKLEDKEMEKVVNHPDHYKSHPMECIDEMIVVFGIDQVISFCRCNAWKYRYRADSKGTAVQDQAKSDWYVAKAEELERLKRLDRIVVSGNGNNNIIK